MNTGVMHFILGFRVFLSQEMHKIKKLECCNTLTLEAT